VGKCVVDPRGGGIVGIGEIYAGRQRGRGDVAVGAQPTHGAVVGALGEGVWGPAQAVLGERGRAGARALQRAAGGGAFAGQRGNEHPGLNRAIRVPHNRAQVEIVQSSTVMMLPLVCTIRAATRWARARLR
jgi:hypothetical protein